MPALSADLMLLPQLRNPTSDSSIPGSDLTVPSTPATILGIYQEGKQLQDAAVKLTNPAIKTAKEFSCTGECYGSHKDNVTDAAF